MESVSGRISAATRQLGISPDSLSRADPRAVDYQLVCALVDLEEALELIDIVRFGGEEPLKGQDPLPM